MTTDDTRAWDRAAGVCARGSQYRTTLLPRPDLVVDDPATSAQVRLRTAIGGDATAALVACLVGGLLVRPLSGTRLLTLVAAGPLLWIATLALIGAYSPRVLGAGRIDRVPVLVCGIALTVGVLGLGPALAAPWMGVALGAGPVALAGVVAVLGSLAVREGLRQRLHAARAQGRGLRRTLVLGHADLAAAAVAALDAAPQRGYAAVAACLPSDGVRVSPPHGIPVAADVVQVLQSVDELGVAAVAVVSDLDISGQATRRLADGLAARGVELLVGESTAAAGWAPAARRVPGLPLRRLDVDPREQARPTGLVRGGAVGGGAVGGGSAALR